jgi:hypothetical protein
MVEHRLSFGDGLLQELYKHLLCIGIVGKLLIDRPLQAGGDVSFVAGILFAPRCRAFFLPQLVP